MPELDALHSNKPGQPPAREITIVTNYAYMECTMSPVTNEEYLAFVLRNNAAYTALTTQGAGDERNERRVICRSR